MLNRIFRSATNRLHSLAGCPGGASEPNPAAFEALEDRRMLDAAPLNLMARLTGDIITPGSATVLPVAVHAGDFKLSGGSTLLAIRVEAEPGSNLDPAAPRVFDASGRPMPVHVAASNIAPHASLLVTELRLGSYTISVRGDEGTTGRFRLSVSLVGDVDGDLEVTNKDTDRIRGAYGSTTGNPHFVPEADINGDGIISGQDLALHLRNLNDETVIRPLSLTAALLSQTGQMPDGTPATNTVRPIIAGLTGLAAIVSIDADGDGFDDGSGKPRTAQGRYDIQTAPLRQGVSTLSIRAADSFGQSTQTTLRILVDSIAPAAPTVSLSADSDSAPLGDNRTTRRYIVLEGTADAGTTLTVSQSQESAQPDASGHYRLQGVQLNSDANSLQVLARDYAGNTASRSLVITRTVPSDDSQLALEWNDAALEAARLYGSAPPQISRALAMTFAAMYDAINSINDASASFYVRTAAPAGASAPAAAAAAAHRVLSSLFPIYSQNPLPVVNDSLDGLLARHLSQIPQGQSKSDGIAAGEAVADLLLALRAQDGSDDFEPFAGSDLPGHWRPTGPAYEPALLPQWATLTPFAMTSPDQFRPNGPDALNTDRYLADFNELKSLGGVDSTARTAAQTTIARFWADGAGTYSPAGHWSQIAASLASREHLSLFDTARLMAQLNVAMGDAAIVAWDAKFTFANWRPVTAIHEADTDGIPGTTADPTWESLVNTPAFPDYVSGHSTFSGAAETILSAWFGANTSFVVEKFRLPGSADPVERRTFSSFAAAADEASVSRIYGGIHFRRACDDGLTAGRRLGEFVLGRFGEVTDTAPPVLTLQAPGVVSGALSVSGRAIDGLSSISQLERQVDNGPWLPLQCDATTGVFAFQVVLPTDGSADGQHQVLLRARDSFGNLSPEHAHAFTLDTAAPSIRLDSPATGQPLATADRVTGALDSTGSSIIAATVRFDALEPAPLSFDPTTGAFDQRLNLSGLSLGAHALTVTATDAAGNQFERSVSVSIATAPSLTLTRVEPRADQTAIGLTQRPRIDFSRPVDPDSLSPANLFLSFSGVVLPTQIIISDDRTSAWLFPIDPKTGESRPFPAGSLLTLTVRGGDASNPGIRTLDGALLDADADGAAGGTLVQRFSTVSQTPAPNTTLSGVVIDPGPDLMPFSNDDVRPGPDGLLMTADDIFLRPLTHAQVHIIGRESESVFTDSQGRFTLVNVPSGSVKVVVSGLTATSVPADIYFPEMTMDVDVAAGRNNYVDAGMRSATGHDDASTSPAVVLPRLRTAILVTVDTTRPTQIQAIPQATPNLSPQQRGQLKLELQPGSIVGADGRPILDARVGISTVPAQLVRDMLPPGVLEHTFDITIQARSADGREVAAFTAPAKITFPNVFGAAPGTRLNVLSFDHTTGRLVIEGTATVSADGASVTSDPGTGIVRPGWHGLTPPGTDFDDNDGGPDDSPPTDSDDDGTPDSQDDDDDNDHLPDADDRDRDDNDTPNFQEDADDDDVPDFLDQDDDNDGTPDAEDADDDNDGTPDDEEDADQDGTPDDQDTDDDNDGIPDDGDPDADNNGLTDEEDMDDDNDGIPDSQEDVDHDGTPDQEDADIDGDGTPNDQDGDQNGDSIPDDQQDQDHDGTPDRRDPDSDGDHHSDRCDTAHLASLALDVISQGFRIAAMWNLAFAAISCTISITNQALQIATQMEEMAANPTASCATVTVLRANLNLLSAALGDCGPIGNPIDLVQRVVDTARAALTIASDIGNALNCLPSSLQNEYTFAVGTITDLLTEAERGLQAMFDTRRGPILADLIGDLLNRLAGLACPNGPEDRVDLPQDLRTALHTAAAEGLAFANSGSITQQQADAINSLASRVATAASSGIIERLQSVRAAALAAHPNPSSDDPALGQRLYYRVDVIVESWQEDRLGRRVDIRTSVDNISQGLTTPSGKIRPAPFIPRLGTSPLPANAFALNDSLHRFIQRTSTSLHVQYFNPSTLLFADYTSATSARIPNLPFAPDASSLDTDHDGLSDRAEYIIGSDPAAVDTDGDGVLDLSEILRGENPTGVDPSLGQPSPIGSAALPGSAVDVVVDTPANRPGSTYAYVATEAAGISVIDVSDRLRPIVLSNLDLPGSSVAVSLSSRLSLLAVAGGAAGLTVIDVAIPAAPVIRYTLPINTRAVAVVGDLLICAVGTSLRSYDIATGEPAQSLVVATSAIDRLATDGHVLAVTDRSGSLYTLTIDGASAITARAQLPQVLANYLGRLQVADGILYVGGSDGFGEGYITISVADPAAPQILSYPDDRALAGQMVTPDSPGLAVSVGRPGRTAGYLDVLNTAAPDNTASLRTRIPLGASVDPRAVVIAGSTAFVAAADAGLIVVNYLAPLDRGVPQVQIDALPADVDPLRDGIQVTESSLIDFHATITDESSIQMTEVLLNGQVVLRDAAFPYDLRTPAPRLGSGELPATLQVRARDRAGNIGVSQVINLTVVPDTFAPAIVSTDPADGTSRPDLLTTVNVAFSEPMDPASLNTSTIQLRTSDGNFILANSLAARFRTTLVSLSFPELPAGHYQIVFDAGNIKDRAGNSLGAGLITRDFTLVEATIQWSNPAGGFWDVASNWNLNRVPNASDIVRISVPGTPTITIRSGANSMVRLRSDEPLDMTGGSLSVSEASLLGAGLRLSGGQVGGAALLTVRGGSWTGGTIVQAGIWNTAAFAIQPTPSLVSLLGSFVNTGSATLGGGSLSLTSSAVFTNLPGGTLSLAPGASVVGQGVVDNSGIITRESPQGATATISAPITNSGIINAVAGSITLGSLTSDGEVSSNDQAIVTLQISTLGDGARLTGPGLIKVSGSLTLNGTANFAGSNIELAAADTSPIIGPGTLNLTGHLTITNGRIYNSGGTTITPTGVLDIQNPVNTVAHLGSDVRNSGHINLRSSQPLYLGRQNPGPAPLLDNLAGGEIHIVTSTAINGRHDQAGSIRNSGGAFIWDNPSTLSVNIALSNSAGSTITVNQGVLDAAFTNSGIISVPSTGSVQFRGGAFNDASTIDGSGLFKINGSLTLNGATDFAGSNIELASTDSSPVIGTGILNLTGRLTITNGRIYNSGGTTITSTGVLDIQNPLNSVAHLGSDVRNSGHINLRSDQPLYMGRQNPGPAPLLENLAGGEIHVATSTSISGRHDQAGSIRNSGGAFIWDNPVTLSVNVALTNLAGSTITVNQGVLDAAFTNNGIISVPSTGSVQFRGGAFNDASTIDGSGLFKINGILTLSGTANFAGSNIELASGDVNPIGGAGTLNLTGHLTITNGRIYNNAGTTITSTGVLDIQNPLNTVAHLGSDVRNSGRINLRSSQPLYLGRQNPGPAPLLDNLPGGEIHIVTSTSINGRHDQPGSIRNSGGAFIWDNSSTLSVNVALTNSAGSTITVNQGVLDAAFTNSGIISVPSTGSVQFRGGTFNDASTITGSGLFKINGSLTLSGAANFAGSNIELAAADSSPIIGTGILNLTGRLTITNGRIYNSGGTTITSTGILDIQNPLNTVAHLGSDVRNSGHINLRSDQPLYLGRQNPGPAPLLDNLSGGEIHIVTSTAITGRHDQAGSIRNSGGAFIWDGTHTLDVNVALTNTATSTLLVNQGVLNAGFTNNGVVVVANAAAVQFRGGTFNDASTIDGSGLFKINGSLTLNGTANFAGSNIELAAADGSPIIGAGVLNLTGHLTITNGRIYNSGGTTITSTGVLDIQNPLNTVAHLGSDVRNSGHINLRSSQPLYLGRQNPGPAPLLDNLAGGEIHIVTSTAINGRHDQAGSIRNSGGAFIWDNPSTLSVNIALTNSAGSTITVNQGVLDAAFTNNGIISVPSTGSVQFRGGAFNDTSTISGSGLFKINGSLTLSGTTNFAGSNIELASTDSSPVIGTGILNLTGHLTITNGRIYNNAGTTITSTGVLDIQNPVNTVAHLGSDVRNSGRINLRSSQPLYLGRQNPGPAPLLDNLPGGEIHVAASTSINGRHDQAGSVRNSGGAILWDSAVGLTINTAFANLTGSQLDISAGTLSLAQGLSNSGTIRVRAGAVANLNSGFTNTSLGTLELDIASESSFGRFNIVGLASLGGTARFNFVGGYQPSPGTAFQVLSYTSRTGSFSLTEATNLPPERTLVGRYNPTNFTLEIS